MGTNDPRQAELLEKIRQGIDSALGITGMIGGRFIACSKQLRVEPGTEAFTLLSGEIANLGDLLALVQEIRKGVGFLADRTVTADAFVSWEKSIPLFREIIAALEGKDWITLADLMQYELAPLLEAGEKELAGVRELLA